MDSSPLIVRTASRQPDWPSADVLEEVRADLGSRPPLVPESEVEDVRNALAAVGRREAVVFQAGDCAELFDESSGAAVGRKVGQIRLLADTLRTGLGLGVVAVGRIAGQYAKPRTSPHEAGPDGTVLTSYFGDAVNSRRSDARARVPDPLRLLAAYDAAADALREIRASWSGGPAGERVFASHELLLLDYDQPLTRMGDQRWFCGSAHTGWLGERTRDLDGAHVAFAESIGNPVGVKLGPTTRPADAVELGRRLNPEAEPGRLTFIVRMGTDAVDRALPPIVDAVRRDGVPVVWLSDPLHGNTFATPDGRKTRAVEDACGELASFVRILRERRQWPGGVHLELTPDDVTECVAGRSDARARLPRYRTACDPRLNPDQARHVVDRFITLL
jgi:3-deoxy-7-phosphoheptulonate synthase